ncbi:hypothetical protein [Nocardia caishijiensis]|uniref:hypothetical protein n=1 Tax=Nocardia caishijiensis TaxID=184756 RepID=UPI0012ED3C4C|nr:hypothetical protein [Nocardia caishijiensis]
MITVEGRATCRMAFDYSDEWIPVKVTWDIEQPRNLCYLRISGKNGGELEMKVDSSTGAIYQFIALELPTTEATMTDKGAKSRIDTAPIIDLSPWGEQSPFPGSMQPKYVTADIGIIKTDKSTIVAVQNSEVYEWLICGPVFVGVSEAGALVAIGLHPHSESLLHRAR